MVFGVRRGLRGASVPRWSAQPRPVVSRRGARGEIGPGARASGDGHGRN